MNTDQVFKMKIRKSSDYKFDAAVVDVFDDMVVPSVPYYLEFQRIITEIARDYAKPGSTVYDLGCSTGKLLKSKKLLLMLLIFISLGFTQVHAQERTYSLSVEVDDLRNSSGVLVVALYDRADVFPDEEYKNYLELIKAEILNGAASVDFSYLPEGHYAISILHDENLDGKLKKGVVLPKEGIGFSNYLTIGRSNKPIFSKASVYLNRDRKIKIHVIYLQ